MSATNVSSPASSPLKSSTTKVMQPATLWNTNWLMALDHIFTGLKDGIEINTAMNYFVRSTRLKTLFVSCVLLNGVIFLGSILILDYLMPLLFPSAVDASTAAAEHARATTSFDVLQFLFKNVFWLGPVYFLSFIFNAAWYNDIARLAYEKTYAPSKTQQTAASSSSPANARQEIVSMITDEIYRMPLLQFFLIESSLVAFIPYFGNFLSFVLTSWLNAYYAFDFVWARQSMSFHTKLEYFERHWAYMLGFGAPCALASFFLPFFLSAAIWALLFPIFIVLAIRAKPPHVHNHIIPIPLFKLPKVLNSWLWTCVRKAT